MGSINRIVVLAAALAGGLLAPGPGTAKGERLAGPVPARVLNVVDGDTLVVRARVWLGTRVEARVRIDGVDAPEARGKCADERRLAQDARAYLGELVKNGVVVLRDIRFGKYAGRVVARVETPDGLNVATALVDAGRARPYTGGRREGWCR